MADEIDDVVGGDGGAWEAALAFRIRLILRDLESLEDAVAASAGSASVRRVLGVLRRLEGAVAELRAAADGVEHPPEEPGPPPADLAWDDDEEADTAV